MYAGLEIVVIDDVDALSVYGSHHAAGRRGVLFSATPSGWADGFAFFEVLIGSTGYGVREDHFVPWTGEEKKSDNEDTRWRRAAQQNWERLYHAKPER